VGVQSGARRIEEGQGSPHSPQPAPAEAPRRCCCPPACWQRRRPAHADRDGWEELVRGGPRRADAGAISIKKRQRHLPQWEAPQRERQQQAPQREREAGGRQQQAPRREAAPRRGREAAPRRERQQQAPWRERQQQAPWRERQQQAPQREREAAPRRCCCPPACWQRPAQADRDGWEELMRGERCGAPEAGACRCE